MTGTLRDRLAAALADEGDPTEDVRYSRADTVLELLAAESSRPRLARYFVRVHASNRHAGYGKQVEVLAATRAEAVKRAIDLGWSGYRDDARVTIDRSPSPADPPTGSSPPAPQPSPRSTASPPPSPTTNPGKSTSPSAAPSSTPSTSPPPQDPRKPHERVASR